MDTAPVMEKPLAARAGLGWQGKHTNLVSRRHGSWLFLGELFTTLALAPDEAEVDHCGILPPMPRRLPDRRLPRALPARRAALHLLPHHRAQGPHRARIPRGHGQQDLWLRRLPRGLPMEQVRAPDLRNSPSCRAPNSPRPGLPTLPRWTTATFRTVFSGSPIKSTRARPLRAQCVDRHRQLQRRRGQAGSETAAEATPSPLVRAMAVWASRRLAPPADFAALRARHALAEADPAVLAEWHGAGPPTGASGGA